MDAGEQAAEQVPAEEPLHLPLPRLTPRQLSHVPAGPRQVQSCYSVTIQFSAKFWVDLYLRVPLAGDLLAKVASSDLLPREEGTSSKST